MEGAVGDIQIPNIDIFRTAPIARPYFQDAPTFRLEKFRTPPPTFNSLHFW
jgi:hypothetical protein